MRYALMERLVRKLNGHSEESDRGVRIKQAPSPENCGECDAFQARDCLSTETVRLSDYGPGDMGLVVQVCGSPDFRLRLMEMGFVKGAQIKVVKYAPLTDPVELEIKGYHVSLRREEAAGILMNPPENGNRTASRAPRHFRHRHRGRP